MLLRLKKKEYSTQQDTLSDLLERLKALVTRRAKRFQHHQTNCTTNVKEASLGQTV